MPCPATPRRSQATRCQSQTPWRQGVRRRIPALKGARCPRSSDRPPCCRGPRAPSSGCGLPRTGSGSRLSPG
eukprot:1900365-Lingulodinium_polyedra.AAC.1